MVDINRFDPGYEISEVEMVDNDFYFLPFFALKVDRTVLYD